MRIDGRPLAGPTARRAATGVMVGRVLPALVLALAAVAGCKEESPDCIAGEGGGVSLSFTGATSERGGTATVAVVLTEAPTKDVTLTFNTTSLAPGVAADRASLNFTAANWDVPQPIVLTAQDNGVRDAAPLTMSTFGLETAETEDGRFACASGFVLVPHTSKSCKDGVLDAAEGEACEPPRNDLGVSVVDLRCALGEASCERCNHDCALVAGEFRAVCGDGLVTDVEQCEPGDTEPCASFGFDRGVATCRTDSCQWDWADCRDVPATCGTADDRCDTCPADEQKHTCVLAADGHARCWGTGHDGVASPPADKVFTQVVDTARFSCGLGADGRATCWGNPLLARDSPGPYVTLVAGGTHVCGRGEDGTVVCWGENGLGQATVPNGLKFKAIAAGRWHTCGVATTGETVCWGRTPGEIGRVPPGETFTSLGAGENRTCGLRADGTVACWGGGLGCVDPEGTFRSLTSGPGAICGLRTDGTIHCFAGGGALDVGYRDVPQAVARDLGGDAERHCAVTETGELRCFGAQGLDLKGLAGPFDQVAVGYGVCGIRPNGQLWCVEDQPGTGFTTGPRQVLQGSFTQVGVFAKVGEPKGCALRTDGRVLCWGDVTAPIGSYRQISVSGLLGCGVRSDDSVGCWGRGAEGLAMPEFDSFSSVSASAGGFACGVRLDGTLLCWDLSREGLFGGRYTMEPPSGRFLSVSAGQSVACAIGDDGESATDGPVTCWGSPAAGIEQVPAGRFTKVVAADTHACGLRTDGRVVCWGQPEQYGRGPDEPTARPPQGTWDEVRVFGKHGCARRGTAWTCWGDDAFGRATLPDATWTQVAVGDELVCVLSARGQTACWHSDGRKEADWTVPGPRQLVAGTRQRCRLLDDRSLDCASDGRRGHVGPYSSLAMGPSAVCGILDTPLVADTDGEVRCFGFGEPAPAPFESLGAGWRPFVAVAVGTHIQCLVNHEAKTQCRGVLSNYPDEAPTQAFKRISVEAGRLCGVTTSDTLACWGRGEAGRPDGAGVRDVQLSFEHGCALLTDGRAQCWGRDEFGNTSIAGGPWEQVDVGVRQTCARDAAGRLACRGWLRR